MRTVEVEDSFMAYREAGAGDTTIVFLHGTCGIVTPEGFCRCARRVDAKAPVLVGHAVHGVRSVPAAGVRPWYDPGSAAGMTSAQVRAF